MKASLIYLIVILSSCIVPNAPDSGTWERKLIWQEEFDYSGLPNPDIWTFETEGNAWGWGNGEDQYYTDQRKENAWVENGVCTITALQEKYADGFEYTSARIISEHKAEWLYGRFEVRAKLPRGQGVWPAIWMMPTNDYYGAWPDSGEIDIMEYFGFMPDTISAAIHTKKYNHKAGTSKGRRILRQGIHDEFHIYAVEWFPDRLDFYFDEELYFTYQKESGGSDVWPYDKPFHMRLNCAIGGDWMRENGGIDNSLFPHRFIIDYVRVYEFVYPGEHRLSVKTEGGGRVERSRNAEAYQAGEILTLKAVPDSGCRFVSWAGDAGGSSPAAKVCMGRDKQILAVFTPENELLNNGSFTLNSSGWQFWHDAAEVSAAYRIIDETFAAHIKDSGTRSWQAQLTQKVELNTRNRYRLYFRARGDSRNPVEAALVRASQPYDGFWRTSFTPEKKWTEYRYEIALDEAAPDSRLEFDMGSSEGNVFLDDISLQVIR